MKVLEEGAKLPMDLPSESAANFHCSPAAAPRDDGTYDLSAVTTASFDLLNGWRTGFRFLVANFG